MKRTIQLLVPLALGCALASCNSRQSPFSPPVAPSVSPELHYLRFVPGSTVGGRTIQGQIGLVLAAPAGGVEVSLSASDPTLLTVPPKVTVAAGQDRLDFSLLVPPLSGGPREVTVTASVGGQPPVSATLNVFPVVPTFYLRWEPLNTTRYVSPPIGQMNAEWVLYLGVHVRAQDFSVWVTFAPPPGEVLRVGTYELRSQGGAQVSGSGDYYCAGEIRGQLHVHELDITSSGLVRSFWASYQRWCGSSHVVFGEVRVTDDRAR